MVLEDPGRPVGDIGSRRTRLSVPDGLASGRADVRMARGVSEPVGERPAGRTDSVGMDTWSALAPALLSLAGVGLGTVGSLVGQHLSSRMNVRQLDAQQWQAHKAELKQSIISFLT